MNRSGTRESRASRLAAALAVVAGLAVVLALPAFASAADPILADVDCCTFAPGPFHQGLGEISEMVIPAEADAPHNVTSTEAGPDGQPLFYSGNNLAGTTTPVAGTQYLDAGSYPFYCTLHGATMSGELVVDAGAGAPAARPRVKVAYPAQKLKRIRKKGVRVKLTGLAAATGVALEVRLVGKGVIGKKEGLELAAGQSRVLTFRLPKKVKRSIRKRRAVKFKAATTVVFGAPASFTSRRIK